MAAAGRTGRAPGRRAARASAARHGRPDDDRADDSMDADVGRPLPMQPWKNVQGSTVAATTGQLLTAEPVGYPLIIYPFIGLNNLVIRVSPTTTASRGLFRGV